MAFKRGDMVKLSAKGVAEFSRNDWSGYSIPHELFRAGAGVVTSIQGDNIYVTTDEGVVWFFEYHLEPAESKVEETPVRNKYMREIKPGVWVDVYDVLDAFKVTDQALGHLIKKALAVGQRGHKDATQDYKDILDSAKRANEIHLETKGE